MSEQQFVFPQHNCAISFPISDINLLKYMYDKEEKREELINKKVSGFAAMLVVTSGVTKISLNSLLRVEPRIFVWIYFAGLLVSGLLLICAFIQRPEAKNEKGNTTPFYLWQDFLELRMKNREKEKYLSYSSKAFFIVFGIFVLLSATSGIGEKKPLLYRLVLLLSELLNSQP